MFSGCLYKEGTASTHTSIIKILNKKRLTMYVYRIFIKYLVILFVLLLLPPDVTAQMKSVYKFKNLQIPFDLKHNDSTFNKSKYDIEILRQQTTWYLRLIKNRKFLCTIIGTSLEYENKGTDKLEDPDIPDKPTLKMKKLPEENVLEIIFETGKKANLYPFCKVSFKIGYAE